MERQEYQETLPDMPSDREIIRSLPEKDRFDLKLEILRKKDELNQLIAEIDDMSNLYEQ